MDDREETNHSGRPRTRLAGPLIFCAASGLVALILLLFRAIAFQRPVLAEVYSRYIFTPLARIWTWPVSLVPFSITECLLVAGTPLALFFLVFGLVRLIRRREEAGRRALRAGLAVLGIAFLLLSLFMLFHGMNYARPPLADSLGLPVHERPVEDLEAAMRRLGRAASEVREGLAEDEQGVLEAGPVKEIFRTAFQGWDQAATHWPALSSPVRARPKGVLLSRYWSHTRIVGLYMPLLVEPNVNIDQPAFMIPVTAAHEMAHARGLAREADCDFAAILSCLSHDQALWRYSGLISAWKSVGRRLWEEDQDSWNRIYTETLSPGVIRDLEAERAYWKAFETPLADISERINDAYLKANRVREGVKSYGAVVDLLLAWLETLDSLTLLPEEAIE